MLPPVRTGPFSFTLTADPSRLSIRLFSESERATYFAIHPKSPPFDKSRYDTRIIGGFSVLIRQNASSYAYFMPGLKIRHRAAVRTNNSRTSSNRASTKIVPERTPAWVRFDTNHDVIARARVHASASFRLGRDTGRREDGKFWRWFGGGHRRLHRSPPPSWAWAPRVRVQGVFVP